ncbi:amidophosphoribosyltransferase [Fulvivirga sedimenti]|uniref:Amidophosphoribosyltransferase n=1 Tax=Fulvivirga sedimenti TaxID=2879465 RepID=A0A9X1HSS5_9BACT|nr:amidophosphoribosyltransferase [Fulvivirga sedimenti]MCA6075393.1 amidophosphoribosyltransferase [Fulvivirga sedimenti]MCA6076570.1 amidophosphoribosyltransferase [Fulvivirga sedimenti]MCA6077698.1 amidophosphoribosyltransferase [Fulvivirga sedimenti]
MSEQIKHECGIAMVRLRKPLAYYIEKYGTPAYAANKMYILMEKQRNRGQDGVGIANIKIDQKPGLRYISRYRSIDQEPIKRIFEKIAKKYKRARNEGGERFYDEQWMKENCAFTGEVWLGHLRYGTHGKNSIENCHPFLRQNNWRSRNLVVAGNFNMTNVDELFDILVRLGQHPKEKVDTVTVMEKIGHFLDEENNEIFRKYKDEYSNQEITEVIESEIDLQRVLSRACKDFDGGYAMAGMVGHGDAFVARDPNGIRPAYFYKDDEVIVVASEKPAIKTAFNVDYEQIEEIKPGHALIMKKNGEADQFKFIEPGTKTSCSFERIYFSRGTDPDIYQERKQLGRLLVPQVLKAINFDLKNTVFSYIPNTAETAFLGLMSGMEDYLSALRKEVVLEKKPVMDSLEDFLTFRPRVEKIILKDAKLRTFITDDNSRDEMVAHVYDTTYEVIRKGVDTLVIMDDSIVRGTTLEKSILTMLARLEPKKVVIVSSAPQIRFPDCYGIDMSKMSEFVAFRAMVGLIKDHNKEHLLGEVYERAKWALEKGEAINHVNTLYNEFSVEEISAKIAEIVKPEEMTADLEVLYQTVENLHEACPNHLGDWYFTGNFPTRGGMRVANRSFVNYMEGKMVRAY